MAPFSLRGISLLGINSVTRPHEGQRLCSGLSLTQLDEMTREIRIGEAIEVAHELLDGKVRRRVVVDVNR